MDEDNNQNKQQYLIENTSETSNLAFLPPTEDFTAYASEKVINATFASVSSKSSSVTSTKIPRLYEAENYKSKYFGICVKPGIT